MSSKKIYHQHTRFLNNSKLSLSPRLFIYSLWPRSYSWKDPQCTFKVQQCMEYSASTQQMQLPTATPTILRSRPSCTLLLVNPSPQRWAARISLLSISTSTSSPCSHCSHIQTNALPGPTYHTNTNIARALALSDVEICTGVEAEGTVSLIFPRPVPRCSVSCQIWKRGRSQTSYRYILRPT